VARGDGCGNWVRFPQLRGNTSNEALADHCPANNQSDLSLVLRPLHSTSLHLGRYPPWLPWLSGPLSHVLGIDQRISRAEPANNSAASQWKPRGARALAAVAQAYKPRSLAKIKVTGGPGR